jgi:hypothetical protein
VSKVSNEVSAGDVSVGDKIMYEGEEAVIEEITLAPLSEEDYYGPAKPDFITFVLRFGDGTYDEIGRWETDSLFLA